VGHTIVDDDANVGTPSERSSNLHRFGRQEGIGAGEMWIDLTDTLRETILQDRPKRAPL
jgi:hypothetical protein